MVKKILAVVAGAIVLSGCSVTLPGPVSGGAGSIWKSFDGGDTFAPKIDIDGEKKITSADVVAYAFHPTDNQTIYIGTLQSGIFKTTDGGEHWQQIEFPPTKNYGLAIDQSNGDIIYATGVYQTIAKMYRSEDGGENWQEIYTEPGKGPVITALASHPTTPHILYAGTSTGTIIKSTNRGETWTNLTAVKGPVTKILIERGEPETVTALILNQGVITSNDGGGTWNDYSNIDLSTTVSSQNLSGVVATPVVNPQNILTLAEDPSQFGVIYAGAQNGLFRSRDSGKTWEAMDIIESSRQLPIRSIAVNPQNSNEISYASGRAFYKSTDGGARWSTTQLEIDRGVSHIQYQPDDPQVIYFTLRKY